MAVKAGVDLQTNTPLLSNKSFTLLQTHRTNTHKYTMYNTMTHEKVP